MNMLVILLKGCAYGKAGDKLRLPAAEANRLIMKGTARIAEDWRSDMVRKDASYWARLEANRKGV